MRSHEPHDPDLSAADQGRGSSEAPSDFHDLLARVRPDVERRLEACFAKKRALAAPLGEDVSSLLASIEALTLRGGKRFRAALLVAAFCAVEPGGDDAIALEAGAAFELLQTYFLIHDDWMDRDDVRRGGPSVHVMLARHFGSRTLGDASAIVAGDYAQALALEVLAGVPAAPDRIARALACFARIQLDTLVGQQLDLSGRTPDVESLYDLKTGSYTVRGPVLLGAALAGATPAEECALAAFADPLGVAFQLRDDLLGAFSRPEQTGKPQGSDLRAGKRTLLVVEALARSGDVDRAWLSDALARRDLSDAEVAHATDLLERCGARHAVEERASELAARARAALADLRFDPRAVGWLEGACEALTARGH